MLPGDDLAAVSAITGNFQDLRIMGAPVGHPPDSLTADKFSGFRKWRLTHVLADSSR
jgi:hypothetical protein